MSLMAAFGLAALLCWLEAPARARPWLWRGSALALFAAAAASKEVALILPLALFLFSPHKDKDGHAPPNPLLVVGLCVLSLGGLFLPLLMFCFALATVWLIPLFGWVVLGSLGLIAFTLAAHLLEENRSYIRPGQTFTLLEGMTTKGWLLLGLAFLSAIALAWLSLAALRGRLPAALMADQADLD